MEAGLPVMARGVRGPCSVPPSGRVDHSPELLEQPPAVTASRLHLLRIDTLQQVARMGDLLVPSLPSSLRSSLQRGLKCRLADALQIIRSRQRALVEALPVVASQRIRIRDDPRLHRLHHEVHRPFVDIVQVPPVAGMQVRRRLRFHRTFRIHEQHYYAIISTAQCILKATESLVPGTATDELPTNCLPSRSLLERIEKRVHSLPEGSLAVFAGPTALHVDRHPAHGFAPSSPIRHRSPSR